MTNGSLMINQISRTYGSFSLDLKSIIYFYHNAMHYNRRTPCGLQIFVTLYIDGPPRGILYTMIF